MESDRKLRITFVLTGRGLSGGVRVVVKHANLLRERGHDVTIVSERVPYPRKLRSFIKRVRSDARMALGLARDHVDDFTGRLITVPPGAMADRVPDGDAVIATFWKTADPVFELPERCGEKFYFLQHYEAHSWDPATVDATWRLPLKKIVIAQWLADIARERFEDSAVALVPNGVDTVQFDAPQRDMHEPPCVGVMYSPLAWKGTRVAFDALAKAREQLPNLRAVCFGHQQPDASLPLPANTTFHWRPAQAAIRDIYAATDVWLCASTTEGFALPPLEAMACRCPVVCTRCGGPEDFVADGENGYLVDVNDADAMAQRMVDLVTNSAKWRQMSDAAYATRLEYTWDQAVRKFEAALLAPIESGSAKSVSHDAIASAVK